MIVSQEAISYVRFQRTNYCQEFDIQHHYCQDMKLELSRIQSYLPDQVNSILDIGCGLAGIDVLLNRYYRGNIEICLLDKTEMTKSIHYGFKKSMEFYNSFGVTKNFLELNGVSLDRVSFQEVTTNFEIGFDKSFDIVISLKSWGFHFPIQTYLETVFEKIASNGILILDIRKGTDGEKQIENKFGNCKVIFEDDDILKVLSRKGI